MEKTLNPIPVEGSPEYSLEQPSGAFSLEALEYLQFERGKIWFATVFVLFVGLLAYAFYTASWSFAIALCIFAGVYALVFHEKPRVIPVKIDHRGVTLEKRHFFFNEFEAFWIEGVTKNLSILCLRPHSKLRPALQIVCSEISEEHLREIHRYLAKFLPEEQGNLRFSDALVRLFKM